METGNSAGGGCEAVAAKWADADAAHSDCCWECPLSFFSLTACATPAIHMHTHIHTNRSWHYSFPPCISIWLAEAVVVVTLPTSLFVLSSLPTGQLLLLFPPPHYILHWFWWWIHNPPPLQSVSIEFIPAIVLMWWGTVASRSVCVSLDVCVPVSNQS